MQVFSVLKIIEQIHEDYPSLTISNEGESDFIIRIYSEPGKAKGNEYNQNCAAMHYHFFWLRIYDHGI